MADRIIKRKTQKLGANPRSIKMLENDIVSCAKRLSNCNWDNWPIYQRLFTRLVRSALREARRG